MKAMCAGLIDRTEPPRWPFMEAYVVNTENQGSVEWYQMQPVSFGPLVHPNPLDTALAKGTQALKFRSGKSCGAPVDLKHPAIVVTGSQGQSGVSGPFWTPKWAEAYQDYHTRLAAEYDGAPRLRGVSMGMAGLDYEEPFIRYSFASLAAAGLTLELDQQALRAMIDIHCTTWKQTPQEIALNPYNAPGGSWTLYETILGPARAKYGKHLLVLGNNSIRESDLGAAYDAMYAWIKGQGGSLYFQTATPSRVGNLLTTLEKCVALGACAVELPSGYQSSPTLTEAQGQSIQAELLSNARKA